MIDWRLNPMARRLLSDPSHFARLVIQQPLRDYQIGPLRAVLDSVLHERGREFLLVFPRQSGKNEVVAQLLVYMLNLCQRIGGNVVYGATGDGLGMGIERLEARLENPWNRKDWQGRAHPTRRVLDRASVTFLSTHPQAATRGHTAHHLLVIDETQDQTGTHIEAVFTPMRASTNATALYIGTVKTATDYLWTKKAELEQETERDGIQRVFMVSPETVMAEVPAYREFLRTQVRKHGRHHPIVASEYFLQPIDSDGGLFDSRRQALMRGDHPRLDGPEAGRLYLATLDVAGEDEAATDPVARLDNPGRDYTVATVFDVVLPRPGTYSPGPTYRAVDVFVDHGSKHFQEVPGRPALAERLRAWLEHWQVQHLIADESGVGLGLVAWLSSALGPGRVTGYSFGGGAKAALGAAFLAVVETGRFRYWAATPGGAHAPDGVGAPDSVGVPDGATGHALSDSWWFWQQVRRCTYDLPADGRFDRDLRWSVPANARVDTPNGPQAVHDDRLISAALVAEADRLYRSGYLLLGHAQSAVIQPADPLAGTGDVY